EQGYDDENGEGVGNETYFGDEADEGDGELDLEDAGEDDPARQVGAAALNFGTLDHVPDRGAELGSEAASEGAGAKELAFTSFGAACHATRGGAVERALAGLRGETAGCAALVCVATQTLGSTRAPGQIIEEQGAAGAGADGET
ncbi:unnamed protein product, partial [Prorocentrum cordatum]